MGDADYARNQIILDRMARTLIIERDAIPGDDRVVARYGGGVAQGRGQRDRARPRRARLRIRLSVDKGNQFQEGSAAAIAGDVANGIPCEDALSGDRPPYAMVQRSGTVPEPVSAGDDGTLWLFVGTDSGFEGHTSIYYDRIDVTLTPADAGAGAG